MLTKYNTGTIKLNFFVINISWGIHISCVEYEVSRLSNNDFTLKTNTKVVFLSRKMTPRHDDTEQRFALKSVLAPINHPFRRQFGSLDIQIDCLI